VKIGQGTDLAVFWKMFLLKEGKIIQLEKVFIPIRKQKMFKLKKIKYSNWKKEKYSNWKK
jgi:hypothetical protein